MLSREIQRLMALLMGGFMLIILSATYWAIAGQESILQREDNPRRVQAEAALLRGAFYDRNGQRLVSTAAQASGQVLRQTHDPSLYGALGYYSLRYGTDGAEATYDALLRGLPLLDDPRWRIERDLLHRPQRGYDLRVSLDLDLQRRLDALMGDRQGALVALAVPSGDVLALISRPSYNPNTLDADWDALRNSPENPFFNRATQGAYQPGGVLQTSLMLTALLRGDTLNQPYEDANQVVGLDDLQIGCALPPPDADLNLATAYAYGCPAPFLAWAEVVPENVWRSTLSDLRLTIPPTLDGVSRAGNANPASAIPAPTPTTAVAPTLQAALLGQGEITINPLALARMLSAARNQGSAPPLRLLLASRPPEGYGDWQEVVRIGQPDPLMTAQAAQSLSDLLRANLSAWDDARLGGHSAIAYSGSEALTWFYGFADLGEGRSAALVLVIEDEDSASTIQALGVQMLALLADQP